MLALLIPTAWMAKHAATMAPFISAAPRPYSHFPSILGSNPGMMAGYD